MKREYYESTVKGMSFDSEDNPVLLLRILETEKIISFPIGPFEASAIIIKAEGIEPPQALTHDVLSGFFKSHNFKIERLEIYGRTNYIFFARLIYKKWFRTYKMELRPSDGIAFALRADAPIFVNRHLMDVKDQKVSSLFNFVENEESINFLDLEKNKTNYL